MTNQCCKWKPVGLLALLFLSGTMVFAAENAAPATTKDALLEMLPSDCAI